MNRICTKCGDEKTAQRHNWCNSCRRQQAKERYRETKVKQAPGQVTPKLTDLQVAQLEKISAFETEAINAKKKSLYEPAHRSWVVDMIAETQDFLNRNPSR